MKVATWNVNSIRIREQQVVEWLSRHRVDVLCLQETKVVDRDFPRAAFESLGYHLSILGQKSYNGVAMLSLQPPESVRLGFASVSGADADGFDEQKRAIAGVWGGVRIVNLYVPNGSEAGSEKYDYKLRWLKALKVYLEKLQQSGEELCVCGDFNVALEDIDIYKPEGRENHIMATPQERQALRETLGELKDAFRKFTTEGGHFSWWDYRAGGFQRNRGWRIDHIYLSSGLYDQATGCHIDVKPRQGDQPSDHAPVIVEF
ncbi:MAG: exodeoxyribonuclease III [Chloroflexaceae bacterium]|nr:exodeoxyribonuclease III [Chloroflexaceae bacterium]